MAQDKQEFEDFIREDVAESQLCERCGSGGFNLLHVDYERTDGFAEAVFICNNCGKDMKLKYMHPDL